MRNVSKAWLLVGCLLWHFGAASAPVEAPDVRLVIDVSGSMKRNDPNNLRQPAVDLLVRLLPESSKAGVWTFGKFVNMLVPHGQVDDPWRELAKARASDISSVGLFTNIGEALERAAFDRDAPRANPTSIILLTDGMVDIDKSPEKNTAEWRRIVDEIVPELKLAGYKVHTIALSDKADKHLMQRLAMATDGVSEVVDNPDDLLKAFLNAFDLAAPAQQVPLMENRFVVDSSVEEFTALIFRLIAAEQTELIGPDDRVVRQNALPEDVKWHRTDQYDLITVAQPLEGEWRIKAEVAPDTRVTIVSDLHLRVRNLPVNIFRDGVETLDFVLQEDGETIARPEFLNLLDIRVSLQRTAPSAATPDSPEADIWRSDFAGTDTPEDGLFQVELPAFVQLGEYQLTLEVDGKTFQRGFSHRFIVREPFTAQLSEAVGDAGVLQPFLIVRAHSDNILPKQTQMVASVVNPNRRKAVKPLVLTEHDLWRAALALDLPGTYTITVDITGIDKNGDNFEYSLAPFEWTYKPSDTFAPAQPQEQADLEPPVEPEPAPAIPEQEAPSNPTPSSGGLANWVWYSLLALANLILLGGGFWLFRKWMKDPDETKDLESAEQVPPPFIEESLDAIEDPLDDDGFLDEEPVMEDLNEDDEPDEVIEEPLPEAAPIDAFDDTIDAAFVPDMDDLEPSAPATEPEPEPEPEPEDDFGADDLEDELLNRVVNQTEGDEAEAFAKDMRKAQGLDLPEDEMDDAISDLIDDLDNNPDENDENPEDKT